MTGGKRSSIFGGDKDRELFIATLAEACAKTDWQVHAYCLMGNHFHLVVETPQGNVVAGMKWIAARLQMGTGASLSNLLSAERRGRR